MALRLGMVYADTRDGRAHHRSLGRAAFDDLESMLDGAHPEVVFVAVPPHRSVALLERLVSTYAEALQADRLTRVVVAATGAPG